MSTQMAMAALAAAAREPAAAESMSMTGMMDVMLIAAFVGCGFYSIYAYLVQRKERTVLENKVICPGGCDPKKCRDPRAFLTFMLPRTLALGVGLVLLGGLILLDHFFGGASVWLTVLLMLLPIGLFVWYVRGQHKAARLFWSGREPGRRP